MLYFVNPKGRTVSKSKPSAKQVAARKKFARMAKARAKASKQSTKRASTGARMAKRKGTAKRRRRSSAKRRGAVTTLRRRSVYVTNPRRKRRRGTAVVKRRGKSRRYRRNPPSMRGILGAVKQTAIDTALVLGGGAVGRVIGGFLPSMKDSKGAINPYVEAAKGTAVAVGVRLIGRRFLGDDKSRFAAAGAMQPVLKNLLLTFAPSAASFLGDYEPMGSYGVGSYGIGDPYDNGNYLAGGADTSSDLNTQDVGSYEIY